MKVAVIIASAGRPEVLHDTLISLRRQSIRPAQIIASVSGDADILPASRDLCEVVCGEKGLTRQRNHGIAHLRDEIELVTFIDDDSELRDDYLFMAARTFGEFPALVLASGREIADGNIEREEARRRLAEDAAYRDPRVAITLRSGDINDDIWGCNMTARRRVFERARFDERLPLYSWMEDYDFGLACAAMGRVARIENCRMIHLSVESGRVAPESLGFSHVMNPIYIWSKGYADYPFTRMFGHVARVVIGNLVKFPRDPQRRWRRIKGNFAALAMVMQGELRPEEMPRGANDRRRDLAGKRRTSSTPANPK